MTITLDPGTATELRRIAYLQPLRFRECSRFLMALADQIQTQQLQEEQWDAGAGQRFPPGSGHRGSLDQEPRIPLRSLDSLRSEQKTKGGYPMRWVRGVSYRSEVPVTKPTP